MRQVGQLGGDTENGGDHRETGTINTPIIPPGDFCIFVFLEIKFCSTASRFWPAMFYGQYIHIYFSPILVLFCIRIINVRMKWLNEQICHQEISPLSEWTVVIYTEQHGTWNWIKSLKSSPNMCFFFLYVWLAVWHRSIYLTITLKPESPPLYLALATVIPVRSCAQIWILGRPNYF